MGFYVREGIDFSVVTGTVFHKHVLETLFIEVNITATAKKITMANAYRSNISPPGLTLNQQFDLFAEYLDNLLDLYSSKHEPLYLKKNIDLLKLADCNFCITYLNSLTAHGFLQLMTRPTRCTLFTCKCTSILLDSRLFVCKITKL